jgi:uncharacterized protein with LGFP repeats
MQSLQMRAYQRLSFTSDCWWEHQSMSDGQINHGLSGSNANISIYFIVYLKSVWTISITDSDQCSYAGSTKTQNELEDSFSKTSASTKLEIQYTKKPSKHANFCSHWSVQAYTIRTWVSSCRPHKISTIAHTTKLSRNESKRICPMLQLRTTYLKARSGRGVAW